MPTQQDLVETVGAEGVRDPRVLAALADVPREAYVPPELAADAYRDRPLPIARGQVTTQPSLIARMVAALGLEGGERVLEIGTGYGFQTALLGGLARLVWSVERFEDIAGIARENLAAQGVRNVEVVIGDGTEGLPEHAPFDAIVVSAAFPEVPAPLAEQLAERGRLVQPIGYGGNDEVVLYERGEEGLVPRSTVTLAHFVRLYGSHAFGPD
jgi:protein-L-isoaspartate(D-aspartate) O-methyltransferase